jgi:hypothetical protein
MRLDYDQLVADYETGLFTRLRGFGPAAEFLETWVPDEDPVDSLLNMVEAAEIAGRAALSVYIGPATAQRLDVAALTARAGTIGTVRIEPQGDGLAFEVRDIGA